VHSTQRNGGFASTTRAIHRNYQASRGLKLPAFSKPKVIGRRRRTLTGLSG